MSSSDLAVSVRGLSKSYAISHAAPRATTLSEALMLGLSSRSRKPELETFWALKDVSFDINKGDVVGMIGRNGAGKSTLLKVLSRITEPTVGQIDLYGRVGSLLEVGTGFHAELTGRENIYLNGAILGMSKREIASHFDAIIDFSGVEQFLDTPVKRYSSGMYVRLAFAVAAHLEPEILIVDEVLAVGDAEFQKKCLGKMQDVAAHGRTILFVSHNMAAVQGLCTRAMMFEHGQLSKAGDVDSIVRYYLEHTLPSVVQQTALAQRTDRSGNGSVRLTSFHIEDAQGNRLPAVVSGMDITFVFGYQCPGPDKPSAIDIGCSVSTTAQETLFVLYSSYLDQTFNPPSSHGEFRCTIPRLPLSAGRYSVGARIVAGGEEADWPHDGVGYLEVEAGDFYKTGRIGVGATVPFLVSGSWQVEANK